MFRDKPFASLILLLFVFVPIAGCVGDETPQSPEGTTEDPPEPDPLPTTFTILGEEETTPRPAPVTTQDESPFGPAGPAPTDGGPEPTPTDTAGATPTEEPGPAPTPSPTQAEDPAPSPTPGATTSPTPTPTAASAPAWPQEGSFVRYRTTSGGGSPGGEYRDNVEATIHITYTDGAWQGTCSWQRSERYQDWDDTSGDPTYIWNNTTGSEQVTFAPPRAATAVDIGATLDVPVLLGCDAATLEELTVEDQASHSAPRESDGSPSWYGYWEPEWPAYKYAYWETDGGLLLAWRDQRHYSYRDGWMVDTDAPLP